MSEEHREKARKRMEKLLAVKYAGKAEEDLEDYLDKEYAE